MYNIDSFTPIINPPQISILGINKLLKPIVEGEKKINKVMTLSLTFDHSDDGY